MTEPIEFAEIGQAAINDADEISERIAAGRYRASLSDVETLRNHVRKLAAALEKHVAHGYPHVADLSKGDPVEAKLWTPAKVSWLGDFIVYVETEDGQRHKVERFASHLRIPK